MPGSGKTAIGKIMAKKLNRIFYDSDQIIEGRFGYTISEIFEKMGEKNVKKQVSASVKIQIKKMLKKYSHKDVVEFISKKENLSKKLIYNFCLKLKK